jgi:hypothetical protein
MGGEAKRRKEAVARGEPDPGLKGFKHGDRRRFGKMQDGTIVETVLDKKTGKWVRRNS